MLVFTAHDGIKCKTRTLFVFSSISVSYSFHALEEDSNYWVVYHELLNKPPADYIEEIKFIAATTDPAAGEGIATCGGGSSGESARILLRANVA